MIEKILETVKKYDMISKGDSVLIGLSGGADSVMLTLFFLEIREKYDLKLTAAHVEHGIRGSESLEDAEFCKTLCEKNGIEFKIIHINAPEEAKRNKEGVEEYSRKARYSFFDSIKCDKIATAHNLSDNIETLLFRFARGTSLKGLCGIPPKRGKIIRPLIEISSSEIRNYLNENKIPYRIDSTNSDSNYSRNFIRNDIVPLLKKLNSGFESNAARMIDSLNTDEIYIENKIDLLYSELCKDNKLNISLLKNLSDCEKNRIVAKWLNENNLTVNDNVICGVVGLLYKNARFQIKGSLFAVSAAGFIRLVDISGNNENNRFTVDKFTVSVKDFLNKCEFNNKNFDFYCDCDKIVGNAVVRCRKEGDCISLNGRNCTKSLKKLFNEMHIPPEERNKIPVIADDNGVIGVAGIAVSKRVCVSKNTKNILVINIRTED